MVTPYECHLRWNRDAAAAASPMPRRAGRPRRCWLVGIAAVWLTCGLAFAGSDRPSGTREGFSSSVDGLTGHLLDAWRATVLVEGRELVAGPGDGLRLRTQRGAGTIVRLASGGRAAVVATNAHVVRCREQDCGVRVGFSTADDPAATLWSQVARVASRNDSRDLAFLEVTVPEGAGIAVAQLASAQCVTAGGPGTVLAIGWPDLTVRESWGVPPPPNYQEHVKRYSEGVHLISLNGYRPHPAARVKMERMQVLFHNADVLPGSSGGPLVDLGGDVLGLNTHVVGNADSPHNEYCARQDLHESNGCVHLAIASEEVAAEFERIFDNVLSLADCVDRPGRTVRAALDGPDVHAGR